ncbi:MAG: cellulase family glycosylhydrolase [Bacteriovoracaceae bacterium]|nr:cellulase family glycosylhydrolase [Bacteriovoracaceae bacterium]
MTKFFTFSLLSLFMVSCVWAGSSMKLTLDGKVLKNKNGETVTLRGVAIADPQHLDLKTWDRPGVNSVSRVKEIISLLKVNVIRLPILPESSEGTGFLNSPKAYFNNHLLPILEYCLTKKIYVIVDLHYVEDFTKVKKKAHKFWKILAPKLSGFPHIIYQAFNEATTPHNWEQYKDQIARPIIKIIRKSNPEAIVIVGSPRWNTLSVEVNNSPLDEKGVLYSVHIYPNEWKSANFNTKYLPLLKNHPVILSEWGFSQNPKLAKLYGDKDSYAYPLLKVFEENGGHHVAWVYDSLWVPSLLEKNHVMSQSFGEFFKNFINSKK